MYQNGTTKIYALFHQKFKGIGIFPILLVFSMSLYYNLILAYSIYFLIQSFKTELPWALPEGSAEYWNRDYFYNDFLHSTKDINEMGIIKN
jgi:solute carrier family 6 GABA transporter-like protein 6/8/11/12/13